MLVNAVKLVGMCDFDELTALETSEIMKKDGKKKPFPVGKGPQRP